MSDTVPLVYDEEGAGPLLVAVHGMTEDRHFWDRVPLAEHFRTIRVDLRGHGQSPHVPPYDPQTLASDVHALVATLEPQERPLLVGHSLGGVVVTAYASRHAVRGVVNVDQTLDVAPLKAEVAEAMRGDGFEAFMTAAFARMYGQLDPTIAEVLEARRSLRQDVVLGAWEPLLTLDADSLRRWMNDIVRLSQSVPYLSLHGSRHRADYATWLGERIPGAHVEAAPITTHYPHLADPGWFLDRLVAFNATIPATPSR